MVKISIIKGYEGLYMIGNDGTVYSIGRSQGNNIVPYKDIRIKKTSYNKRIDGYKTVSLSKFGKNKTVYVHRLVAYTFIPNPENKPQVNHLDGNKDNNSVNNLEWSTQKENMLHASNNDLTSRKLSNKELYIILNDLDNSNMSIREISNKYNVDYQIVLRLNNCTSNKHLKRPINEKFVYGRSVYKFLPSEEKIIKNMKFKEANLKFGVLETTFYKIKSRSR